LASPFLHPPRGTNQYQAANHEENTGACLPTDEIEEPGYDTQADGGNPNVEVAFAARSGSKRNAPERKQKPERPGGKRH
jgi:hypothetical protein